MINNENIIAAIDVGTTKTVAIIAQKNEDGSLEILGLGNEKSIGVRHGSILNITETVNCIKAAISTAQDQANVKIDNVYVGIAGQDIRSICSSGGITRKSTENEISAEDIKELILSMHGTSVNVGEKILHVIPQTYNIDGISCETKPIGMSGKRLDANCHIVICRMESTEQLKKCIERSGLTVNETFLQPLASSAAVLTEDEKEVGVALIDIGGGTTDIAVYINNIIQHTAVIPLGGDNITKDLQKGLAILKDAAEKVKIQCGHAISDDSSLQNKVAVVKGINNRPPKEFSYKRIAQIIQARLDDIFDIARFELESAGLLKQLGAGIVVTGGGALLNNIQQYIYYKCNNESRIGKPSIRITENKTGEKTDDITSPVYSTSIGLLMLGLEHQLTNHEKHNAEKQKTQEQKKDEGDAKYLTPEEIQAVELASEEINKKGKKRIITTIFNKITDLLDNQMGGSNLFSLKEEKININQQKEQN